MGSISHNQHLEHLVAACQSFISSALPDDRGSVALVTNKLQDTVKLLSERLTLLKLRSNTFSPIFNLPTEVLTLIFKFAISLSYKVQGLRNVWNTAMSPSQTCHAWRELALCLEYLWTDPICEFPPLAKEMMRRAGQLPLSLTIRMIPGDEFIPAFWKRVLRPPTTKSKTTPPLKIQHMNITGETYQLCETFPQQFPFSLPHIESFGLHVYDIDSHFQPGILIPIPETHMLGTPAKLVAPLLRSLSLTNCIAMPESGILENLTALHLRLVEDQGLIRLTDDELFDILDTARNLNTLKLDNMISPGIPEEPHRTVPLNHLTLLSIQDFHTDVLRISSFILFPASTSVNICLTDKAPLQPTIPISPEHLVPVHLHSQLQGMRLAQTSGRCHLHFRVLDDAPRIDGRYSSWNLRVELRSALPEVFRQIIRKFSLRSVEDLRIECHGWCTPPNEDEWRKLLSLTSSLRSMDLTGNIALPLIILLSKADSSPVSPVPHLREVILRRVDLSAHYFKANDAHGYQTKIVDLLIAYLSARRGAGDKLSRLVLDDCPRSQGLRDLLSPLVEGEVVQS